MMLTTATLAAFPVTDGVTVTETFAAEIVDGSCVVARYDAEGNREHLATVRPVTMSPGAAAVGVAAEYAGWGPSALREAAYAAAAFS